MVVSTPRAASARDSASAPSVTSISNVSVSSVKSETGPARSTVPASSTITRSHVRSTSPIRCEESTMLMPNSRPVRTSSSSIARRPIGSRPAVGSSSRITTGSCTRACASFTRCFIPVE